MWRIWRLIQLHIYVDVTLFSYHVIEVVCTHVIIVLMRLGGFEGNEDRVIGGDGRWAQSVTAGREHKDQGDTGKRLAGVMAMAAMSGRWERRGCGL